MHLRGSIHAWPEVLSSTGDEQKSAVRGHEQCNHKRGWCNGRMDRVTTEQDWVRLGTVSISADFTVVVDSVSVVFMEKRRQLPRIVFPIVPQNLPRLAPPGGFALVVPNYREVELGIGRLGTSG